MGMMVRSPCCVGAVGGVTDGVGAGAHDVEFADELQAGSLGISGFNVLRPEAQPRQRESSKKENLFHKIAKILI